MMDKWLINIMLLAGLVVGGGILWYLTWEVLGGCDWPMCLLWSVATVAYGLGIYSVLGAIQANMKG